VSPIFVFLSPGCREKETKKEEKRGETQENDREREKIILFDKSIGRVVWPDPI
jgi:hypothetical protein